MDGSLPKKDIWEAIDFFTGGAFGPNPNDEKWIALDKKIKEHEYDASEFAFFCSYMMGHKEKMAILQRKNYLTSDDVWQKFLIYREHRMCNVRDIMNAQMTEINRLSGLGISLKRILMEPHIAELNAVARIERSLWEPVDWLPDLLEEHGFECWLLVVGSPQYLLYAPHLKKEIDDKSVVYRTLSGE